MSRRELAWPEWHQPSDRYHQHSQSQPSQNSSQHQTSHNQPSQGQYQPRPSYLEYPRANQTPYPLVTSSYRIEAPYSAGPLPSVLPPPPSYDHQGNYCPPPYSSSSSNAFCYSREYGHSSKNLENSSSPSSPPASSSSPTTTPATPESCYTDYSATSTFSSACNSALEVAKDQMRRAKTIAPAVTVGGQPSTVGQTPVDRIMLVLGKQCYASSSTPPTPASTSPVDKMPTSSSPKGVDMLLDRRSVSPTSPKAASPIGPASGSPSSRVAKRPAKLFTCHVCGKTCAQRTGLDTHMRVHTGERPYKCRFPGCGSTFTQSGNRTTHEENHSGEKKYKCDICGRGFGQRGNRNKHVKKHMAKGQNEKPFVCCLDACTKSFTELGNLKNHLNRYHGPTLEKWMARLIETSSSEDLTAEEREVSDYLNVIFKNLNKGIRGRGPSRYVSTARAIHDSNVVIIPGHDLVRRDAVLPALASSPPSSMVVVPSQDPRHAMGPPATLQPAPYGLSPYTAYPYY